MAQELRARRRVFWAQGEPLPMDVSLGLLLGAGVPVAVAGYYVFINQWDLIPKLAASAIGVLVIYLIVVGLFPATIVRSWRERTWEKVAVGLSYEGGGRLLALGSAGLLFMLLYAQIPSFTVSTPVYALVAHRFVTTVFVAPAVEEPLFGGAVFSLFKNLGKGQWSVVFGVVATAVTFTGYHQLVYGGEPTNLIYVFILRLVIGAINWAPTYWGHAPSILPGLATHVGGNGIYYWVTCVLAEQASRYC